MAESVEELVRMEDPDSFLTTYELDKIRDGNEFSTASKFLRMMKFERLRLASFLLPGRRWPRYELFSPLDMAKAGFFHVKSDEVQCAFCWIIISNWEPGDDIMEEHRKHSPNCPFVQGEFVCNVTLESDPEVNSSNAASVVSNPTSQNPRSSRYRYNDSEVPRHIEYSSLEARIESFNTPNWDSKLDSRKLAEAGFFFSEHTPMFEGDRGGMSDRSRCFHCSGILCNWVDEDDPLEEHVKFFPKCQFMHTKMPVEYFEFIQQKGQMIDIRSQWNTSNSITKRDIQCLNNMTFENYLQIKDAAAMITDNNIDSDDDSAVTSSVSSNSSGTSSNSTQESVVLSYLNRFLFFSEANELFQYLRRYSSWPTTNNRTTGGHTTSKVVAPICLEVVESKVGCSSGIDSGHSSSPESPTTEEASNSRSVLECTICYDNQIGIVFIPCGHQLACTVCAEKLFDCPVCRRRIKSKVRTFFCN